MNIKPLCVFVLGGLAYSLASCGNSDTIKGGTIDVATALAAPVELKASDCFRKVRYLPLETTDSCLVGNNPQIKIAGDKIIVMSGQRCLAFDKTTGRFICSIGHVGNDPEGYGSVTFFADNKPDESLYFTGWNNELVRYGTDGTFKGKVKVPLDPKKNKVGIYSNVDDQLFIGSYTNLFGGGNEKLLFFRGNEPVHSIDFSYDSQDINPSDIGSVSVVNGEVAAGIFGPAARDGVLIINFKEPERGTISFKGNNRMWHVGKDLYYKYTYNDTIYQVVDTTLVPSSVFGLGSYHWDAADRFNKERGNKAILIGHVMDSRDRMIFSFITNLFDKAEVYNAIYTKKTGEVKVGDYKEGLKDDLTHFLPLQPWCVSVDGEYASLIPADEVVEWFDTQEGKTESLPAGLQVLKHVSEEDNPVIAFME